jgi:hypothetical protein
MMIREEKSGNCDGRRTTTKSQRKDGATRGKRGTVESAGVASKSLQLFLHQQYDYNEEKNRKKRLFGLLFGWRCTRRRRRARGGTRGDSAHAGDGERWLIDANTGSYSADPYDAYSRRRVGRSSAVDGGGGGGSGNG